MGTAASRGRLPPEALEHMALFRTIGLNERLVEKLYRGFSKIDKDGSGELSLFELLDHLKVSKTPFTKRVFSIFDEDGSGSIDFREFVLSTWNYATLTKSTLIIFAFDLYDGDGSGSMELEEIMDMCKDVYGADFEKSRLAAQIIEKIHKLNDPTRGSGIITLEKFAVFCEHHPGLLYPAFTFQQALQKSIIGVTFWAKLSKERLVMPNGVQVSIKDIITAHIDKNKFKELCVHNDPESDMLLPEKMQREARKTLLQRSDTANFKEIYDATGTVARRRSTQVSLHNAANKIKATRALTSSSSASRRRTEPTINNKKRLSKLPAPGARPTGPSGRVARNNSAQSLMSRPGMSSRSASAMSIPTKNTRTSHQQQPKHRASAAAAAAPHGRKNSAVSKLRIEPTTGPEIRARPVL